MKISARHAPGLRCRRDVRLSVRKNHTARLPASVPESYTNQVTPEVAVNAGQFIQWQDLFVLVDDGSIPISRYAPLEAGIRELGRTYPQGVALMCILPPDTRPPPEDVRRFVKATLNRLAPSLSSLAYVIEGTGFKAVAVRATLVGMKIFSSRPYPIYVEVSVREAVSKMSAHMASGQALSVEIVTKAIAEARLTWQTQQMSARAPESEMTLK